MRDIDWDQPLTKLDKVWLDQRMTPELAQKMDENAKKFSSKSAASAGPAKNPSSSTETKDDDKFDDDYDKWKVEELKAECEGRVPKVDTTGITKKEHYIAALRTWDAEHPDAE